jgi:dTDP-4-amino-4,6-dideoxygalactose transaminase
MIDYENLARANEAAMAELEEAARRVLRSGWYVLGEEVAQFEAEFAAYVGARHCVGVGNGLDALALALEALELPPGSEVIVAANTYIATILGVLRAGLKPVAIEPERDTFNMDAARLRDALTPNTRAILVTHLFGKPCRMDRIGEFAHQHGLQLLEDCAQSHGARLSGRMTGTFGVAGCFSFYPTKNLGAAGDAGAVTTDDDAVAERLRHLRNYGSKIKYVNEFLGCNSRLDELQAALLRVKLKRLDAMTAHKRMLAEIYFDELPKALVAPRRRDDEFDVFHIFAARARRRDELRQWLLENGVKTEVHYPIPPHRQRALAGVLRGEFPITDELHASELSLPISFGHSVDDIRRVCEILRRAPLLDAAAAE